MWGLGVRTAAALELLATLRVPEHCETTGLMLLTPLLISKERKARLRELLMKGADSSLGSTNLTRNKGKEAPLLGTGWGHSRDPGR